MCPAFTMERESKRTVAIRQKSQGLEKNRSSDESKQADFPPYNLPTEKTKMIVYGTTNMISCLEAQTDTPLY